MYSIIVPIYMVEEYLPQCIESVLVQTHNDFELILVDDGSPDNCPRICEEYAQRDSRIKVVHKPNGGLVSARKAGLEQAAGEYICFIDGDDYVACDMLETFDKILTEEKYDIICSAFSKYYSNGHVVPVKQNVNVGCYDKKSLIDHIYPNMLSTQNFFHFGVMPNIWTKCIKKSILCEIYKNTPNDISLGEDVAVSYPALLKANKIYFLDYCGYMYRQNPNSMTHTYDKKLFTKVRNLIVYLKTMKDDYGWKDNGQIDEYAMFLLILAKDNEFKYNNSDTYRNKRSNMKRYLNEPVFKEALKNITLHGLKNKFILFCFKARFLMPIYLYESIRKARESNE